MDITRLLMGAGLALALTSTLLAQNILYQHNFNGTAATPLHRLASDDDNNGGANTWTTRTDNGLLSGTGREWYADGHIDTVIDPGTNGAASLGFAPIAGNIYTLTAKFNSIFTDGTGDAFSWVGLGFSAGQATGAGAGAEFFGNGTPSQVTGEPWMLVRADNSQFPNQTFLGPSTFSGQNWSTPVTAVGGDPIDLQIVLNTTTPLWSVEWLAKKPTDPTYTSLRTTAYATNPTIRAIAVASNFNIGGSIDSLTLTTSGSTYAPGDTNGNGMADVTDFNTIRNNFFNTAQGPTSGDFNNDGIVDYVDFRTWKDHAPPSVLAAVGVVPEPAGVLLAVMSFGLLATPGCGRQGRRQRQPAKVSIL